MVSEVAVGSGRLLAIDVGAARIGVASCDPGWILATPVETVAVGKIGSDRAAARILALLAEYEAVALVVGMPTGLSGKPGAAAAAARGFARRIESRAAVPVVFADERFTTTVATRALRESGVRAKDQRAVIDQAAAVGILQSFIDASRAAGGDRATAEPGAGTVSDAKESDVSTRRVGDIGTSVPNEGNRE